MSECEEIGHSGGKITFFIKTKEKIKSYSIRFTSSRPVPVVLIGLYALPQGIPVAILHLGGIGEYSNPPPFPGCFQVYIASDSQGKFGHHCPQCEGYWRSGPLPNVCPYCAFRAEPYNFLSEAQSRYVHHYVSVLSRAIESIENGEVTIDMDVVADAVGKEVEKPAFYISEESQQCKFICIACDEYNDILGRFGYCSLCGTRNDIQELEGQIVQTIRDRLNNGSSPEDGIRDAVAVFDSLISQYAKQFAARIPMSTQRRARLLKKRFHDLDDVHKILLEWFDINIFHGFKEDQIKSSKKMFFRRHVYEHNAGEVDQKYIEESGDTTVRIKQHLHDTKEDVHAFLNNILGMARNVDKSFHEIFPPISGPIKAFNDKKARIKNWSK